MGLLDFLAPALTTATQAAGAYQGAEAQAEGTKRQGIIDALNLRRMDRQTQIENALHQAQTGEATARANYYAGRTPDPETSDKLRAALVATGRNPDEVDAAVTAAAMPGGSGLLRSLLLPPKTTAPRVLATSSGYVTLGADGHAHPVTNEHDEPVMPPAHAGTGRARSILAESLQHREARQNFNATETQLKGTQSELKALDADKRPLLFQTPADSVAYEQRQAERPALESRKATLSARADSLAAAMGGDYSVPGHPGGNHPIGSRAPGSGKLVSSTAEQREYETAARAFQAAGGPANPDAERTYNRIVAAIAQKYQRGQAATAHTATSPLPSEQ